MTDTVTSLNIAFSPWDTRYKKGVLKLDVKRCDVQIKFAMN